MADLNVYTSSVYQDGRALEDAIAKGVKASQDLTNKVDKTRKINGLTLTSDIELNKADIGLGNVDNTSDYNKPVSAAVQMALNGKVDSIDGKGLSTNDFTNDLKSKVENAATQSDIDEVKGQNSEAAKQIDYILAKTGNKNRLNLSVATLSQEVQYGVTVTIENGAIKLTGKATSSNQIFIHIDDEDAYAVEELIPTLQISGSSVVAADVWKEIKMANTTSVQGSKFLQANVPTGYRISMIKISIVNGRTYNDTLYPMLIPKGFDTTEFSPYIPSSIDLNKTKLSEAEYYNNGGGGKNIINLTSLATQTNKGLTFINQGDGGVYVSGTTTSADAFLNVFFSTDSFPYGIQPGDTIDAMVGAFFEDVKLQWAAYTTTWKATQSVGFGEKKTYTIPSDATGFFIRITVPQSGVEVDSIVYPMIKKASIENDEFVPYVPTNRELYEDVKNKVDKVSGKGLSTNDFTTEEKQKLAELENYDDTELRDDVIQLNSRIAKIGSMKVLESPISNKAVIYELVSDKASPSGTIMEFTYDNGVHIASASNLFYAPSSEQYGLYTSSDQMHLYLKVKAYNKSCLLYFGNFTMTLVVV